MLRLKAGLVLNGFEFFKSTQTPSVPGAGDVDNNRWNDPEMLFGCDEDDDEVLTEQEHRRLELHAGMMTQVEAVRRSATLVENILSQNKERLQIDDEGRLVIIGQLALYRMDLNAFLQKMVNPFSYHSFDAIEVHPKSKLVESPKHACVQVQQVSQMPAFDFLGGYILGLMNDEHTWLDGTMDPLRVALMDTYGLAKSPLTDSLAFHLEHRFGGKFDHVKGTITFHGTNGWRWRLGFNKPLAEGYKIEYQKPRQSWWTTLFEEHRKESAGHHALGSFMMTVEHLSACPAMLKDCSSWETDPIFIRKVALDYPPLRRALLPEIDDETYDPGEIHTYYDEPLNDRNLTIVTTLDHQIRDLATA